MNDQGPKLLLVFDFSLSAICIGHGLIAFSLLLALTALRIIIKIYDTKTISSFNNGCHRMSPFLLLTVHRPSENKPLDVLAGY